MIELMKEYQQHSNFGELKNEASDMAMNRFFKYADKIIKGIIYAYKFTRFAELDDLIQEARAAVMLSINKNQYDITKGSIFNFISVVTERNLKNFTTKQTRYSHKKSDVDIDVFFNNNSLTYYQNFDKNFIIDDLLQILLDYFAGKPRLEQLTYLLIEYFKTHRSSRFVKKHFINYARAYNYSSALVNTFFDMISRGKLNNKGIKTFLVLINEDVINSAETSKDIM